jgi:hypothetical protein
VSLLVSLVMPARWPSGGLVREYGSEHRKLRVRWKILVDAGGVQCRASYCRHPSRLIEPGSAWVLGHVRDRESYAGPEHKDCGEMDGSLAAAELRTGTPRREHWTTTTDW